MCLVLPAIYPFILSVSRRYYLRWYHTALMMCIFILRQGRTEPKPSEAKPSQRTRGQVHETSIPKIGTVPCNKASSRAEAKPRPSKSRTSQCPSEFAEPSLAKPSLIYKYTKKGVPAGGQGLCLVLPVMHPFILSVSRRYNGMVVHTIWVLYRMALAMRILY